VHTHDDILQHLFASVASRDIDPVMYLAPSIVGYRDTASLGQCLKPGRDTNAIAKDVVAIDDYLVDIDADAQLHALGLGHVGVAF
jgi:hypothetical protein